MTNKESIKWIAIFAAIILLFVGIISSLAIAIKNKSVEAKQVYQAESAESNEVIVNDFKEVNNESENAPTYLSLAFTSDMPVVKTVNASLTSAATTTVSKTITATVLPSTAKNTAVDWSVEWGGTQSGTVTDYVTVTPASAGSTTATVTCKKAFTGEIVIVCTTQEGGYMATCTVTFAGHPTDINLSGSVSEVSGAYNLGIGTAYDYTVTLTNPFDSVGSQFNEVSATVTGVGQIQIGYMEHYNKSGSDKWYDTSYSTIDLDSIKDSLISVSYSGGKITINTLKAIESYYKSTQKLDGGRTLAYNDKFYSYVSDCYFNITLTEAKSGLTKTIKVVFDKSSVTGVNISSTEMEF